MSAAGTTVDPARASFASARSQRASVDMPRTSMDRPESHSASSFSSLRPTSAYQPLEDAPGSVRPASMALFSGQHQRLSVSSTSSSTPPFTFKSIDLRNALHLHDALTRKAYMEGYLLVRHSLGVDGQPDHRAGHFHDWTECFVQLQGTSLSLWEARLLNQAAAEGREVPPTYINVTDAFVDYIGMHVDAPFSDPGSRRTLYHVFALNTAGKNCILFCFHLPPPCDSTKVQQRLSVKNEKHPEHKPVLAWHQVGQRYLQSWINAIRLASWERMRLDEIYTGALIRARLSAVKGPEVSDVSELAVRSPLVRGRHESWVRARFMGSTDWRRCWMVLHSHWADDEPTSGLRRFLRMGPTGDRTSSIFSLNHAGSNDFHGHSHTQPPSPPAGILASPAVAYFYESKRSKHPFASLWHVQHVYAVYPSRSDLVEESVLFKAEGSLPQSPVTSATLHSRQSGWVMFMPDIPAGQTRGANAEMMKWIIALMDAFRLYGRPDQFAWDPRSPASPFFAYPIGPYKDHLFLDRALADYLNMSVEDHLTCRHMMHEIMAARMRGENTMILAPLPELPSTLEPQVTLPEAQAAQSGADQASGVPSFGFERQSVKPPDHVADAGTNHTEPQAENAINQPSTEANALNYDTVGNENGPVMQSSHANQANQGTGAMDPASYNSSMGQEVGQSEWPNHAMVNQEPTNPQSSSYASTGREHIQTAQSTGHIMGQEALEPAQTTAQYEKSQPAQPSDFAADYYAESSVPSFAHFPGPPHQREQTLLASQQASTGDPNVNFVSTDTDSAQGQVHGLPADTRVPVVLPGSRYEKELPQPVELSPPHAQSSEAPTSKLKASAFYIPPRPLATTSSSSFSGPVVHNLASDHTYDQAYRELDHNRVGQGEQAVIHDSNPQHYHMSGQNPTLPPLPIVSTDLDDLDMTIQALVSHPTGAGTTAQPSKTDPHESSSSAYDMTQLASSVPSVWSEATGTSAPGSGSGAGTTPGTASTSTSAPTPTRGLSGSTGAALPAASAKASIPSVPAEIPVSVDESQETVRAMPQHPVNPRHDLIYAWPIPNDPQAKELSPIVEVPSSHSEMSAGGRPPISHDMPQSSFPTASDAPSSAQTCDYRTFYKQTPSSTSSHPALNARAPPVPSQNSASSRPTTASSSVGSAAGSSPSPAIPSTLSFLAPSVGPIASMSVSTPSGLQGTGTIAPNSTIAEHAAEPGLRDTAATANTSKITNRHGLEHAPNDPSSQPLSRSVSPSRTDQDSEAYLLEEYMNDEQTSMPIPSSIPTQVSKSKTTSAPATHSVIVPLSTSSSPSTAAQAKSQVPTMETVPLEARDAHDDDKTYGIPEDQRSPSAPDTMARKVSPVGSTEAYPSSFGRKQQPPPASSSSSPSLSSAIPALPHASARPGRAPGVSHMSHDWVDHDEHASGTQNEETEPVDAGDGAPTLSSSLSNGFGSGSLDDHSEFWLPSSAPFPSGQRQNLQPPHMSYSQSAPIPHAKEPNGVSTAPLANPTFAQQQSLPFSASTSSSLHSNGTPSRSTLLKLDEPHSSNSHPMTGLLASASQDRLSKSARAQEAEARETGQALINMPSKPPPPQAGLMGAIHSRERRTPGPASGTERERDARNSGFSRSTSGSPPAGLSATSAMPHHLSQQQQQQQMFMNMYYWQQQQMMMMMGVMPGMSRESMMAQQQAMQAAQQAYYQAYMQFASSTSSSGSSTPNPPPSMSGSGFPPGAGGPMYMPMSMPTFTPVPPPASFDPSLMMGFGVTPSSSSSGHGSPMRDSTSMQSHRSSLPPGTGSGATASSTYPDAPKSMNRPPFGSRASNRTFQ